MLNIRPVHFLTVFLMLSSLGTMAQKKKKKSQASVTDTVAVSKLTSADTSAKKTTNPYNTIVTSSTITKKGLFTIHQTGNKYYFELPDSIMGMDVLATSWLESTPAGSSMYAGEKIGARAFYFEKGYGNKIYLRGSINSIAVDTVDMMFKALTVNGSTSVLMALDIKATSPDHNAIIDVTDLFLKDNMLVGLGEGKRALNATTLAPDRTFIKSMRSYPKNVEISTVRTYAAMAGAPAAAGPAAGTPMEAATEAATVTVSVRNSFVLLPKEPMTQRLLDKRVGYFAGAHWRYGDEQQRVQDDYFIVKYRLEPKDEDIEKYKRGELVEPKKQIVYYTDPATPKAWRKYIIAGINDWNSAFEQAGFKNAIVGKEWPENDTTMNPEDVRYSIVRYFPSTTQNAYGPNIHDPRTGEIIQSYVGWYHNIMQLLHDWYFVQAAAIDSNARKMKFSEELMGELIRFASSHEIGHTLGLRHNMGSSSTTPVENLRNKAWVEAHGHTPSIMDYARFNYVAQPEDNIGYAGIFPRIGAYDKWAIKFGYRYTGIKDPKEDKKITTKWVYDSLKSNPTLWFGGEGRNNDPRCQTEDVGSNSMEASAYGMKNLKLIMKKLPEWTKEEDNFYENLLQMYRAVFSQYLRYATHVAKNVGGIYETIKTVEQEGNVYAPSPRDRQKQAIAFLHREVFETPYWLIDSAILNKIHSGARPMGVITSQKRILSTVLGEQSMYTLLLCSNRFGSDSTYQLSEMLDDVTNGIWKELNTHQAISVYRRDLQKEHVLQLFRVLREAIHPTKGAAGFLGALMGMPEIEEMMPVMNRSDVPSLLTAHLKKLQSDITKAIPLTTDKMTRVHLETVKLMIENGLNNKFDKSKTILFAKD